MPRREPTVVEQECVQCNAVKPAKDFDKNGSGLNGLRRACKACMKLMRPQPMVSEQECTRCHLTKPAADFYYVPTAAKGLKKQCKACMLAARHKNGDVTVSERQCTKCFVVKPHMQFHRKASGPGGLQPHCISCMKEERPSKRGKTDGPALRVCVHCRQEKKIAQFSRDPSGPEGRQTWCMVCMKEYALANASRLPAPRPFRLTSQAVVSGHQEAGAQLHGGHDVAEAQQQVDGMLQPAGPPLDVGSSALNAAEAAASAMAAGGVPPLEGLQAHAAPAEIAGSQRPSGDEGRLELPAWDGLQAALTGMPQQQHLGGQQNQLGSGAPAPYLSVGVGGAAHSLGQDQHPDPHAGLMASLGVLPQPGLQLPVLAPPDLYLMAPEQALDAAASVSQQPQKLHQQEQHQQIQPQQLQSQQLQSQQEQQQQQAGIAEHAQHSLGYAGEDFTLPPLQGDAGGFPQISVGEHMHVQGVGTLLDHSMATHQPIAVSVETDASRS